MTPAGPADKAMVVFAVILLLGSAFMLGFVVAKMTEPPATASGAVHYPELPEDPIKTPGHDGPSDRALDCSKPGAGRPWC